MKIKAKDLIGPALDWAVAKCEVAARGVHPGYLEIETFLLNHRGGDFCYSTDWSQGGPIVDRGRIFIRPTLTEGGYRTARSVDAVEARIELPNGATVYDPLKVVCEYGPTPLIASMRAYVASKLGEEVEVPEELLESTKRSTK